MQEIVADTLSARGSCQRERGRREGYAMLVLSRKVGERIVIGNGIVVVVKRVSGQRVTFGIEAPHDVKIIRGELEVFQAPQGSADQTASPVTATVPAGVPGFHDSHDALAVMPSKPR